MARRKRIASAAGGIHLIEQSIDRGFPGGRNAGIRVAMELLGADRVLRLNADAIASPSAVAAISRLLDLDHVGGVVTSKTRPPTIQSFGISYSM
jgi:GT2 family glycosyltransferase